jgi:site-specific DNA recombinase
MRALIYCRVSTVEQTQNLSLETQEQACRSYCAREGYDVERVFVDAGESAKTADRPAFLQLLAACRAQKGRVHAVIVYSLTRFSRNTADHHSIAALLRGQGIALRSVTEPIDDSPTGRLMEAILAGVAQFDNDVRSARTVVGMKAALQKGRWCWQPPIGYAAGARGGPSLVLDPDVAPLVRRAFELADSGVVGSALIASLKALGLRERRGKLLVKSRAYRILKHPVYTGRVEIKGWDLSVVGDFAPIVSRDLFDRVQERLAPRRAALKAAVRHRNHPDFPLRRFVRCVACGDCVTGSWSRGQSQKKYAHYHCVRGCTRIPKAELETAFLELLNRLVPRPGYVDALRAVALDLWQTERDTKQRDRRLIEQRVTVAEGRLALLDQAFLYQRSIDDITYHQQRDALREAIALLEVERSEASIDVIDLSGMLDFALHAITHAGTIWTSAASVDERIRMQATFFPDGLRWQPAGRGFRGSSPLGRRRKSLIESPRTDTPGIFIEPRNCLSFFQLEEISSESSVWWPSSPDLGTRLRKWLIHMRDGLRAAA